MSSGSLKTPLFPLLDVVSPSCAVQPAPLPQPKAGAAFVLV